MQTTSTAVSKGIYGMNVVKRSIVVFAGFQAVLWLTFAISCLISPDAFSGASEAVRPAVESGGILSTFLTIFGRNSILFLIIFAANLFVRFGVITLGPIILLIQGITIGHVAGTNAFEYPFVSMMEANLQYLKVGLWETTAYALICAVTMTKSLYIADSFPATKWVDVRELRDLRFSLSEKILVVVSVVLLAMAGYIEAYLIHNLG